MFGFETSFSLKSPSPPLSALSLEMTFKRVYFPVFLGRAHVSVVHVNHYGEIMTSVEYKDFPSAFCFCFVRE